MCGRFTELTNPNQLGFPFADWKPRYNIAPTMPLSAIRSLEGCGGLNREPCQLRWGLVPPWANDHKIGYRTLNARSETIAEKPSFRSAFKKRRCLILVDGYYEWQKIGKQKQTWYFRRPDRQPFLFLGLWEAWSGPKGEPLDVPMESCTIITMDADELTQPIHNRMPCLGSLDNEGIDTWLDPEFQDARHLQGIMTSGLGEPLEAVRVGAFVNKVGNEGAGCIEEV